MEHLSNPVSHFSSFLLSFAGDEQAISTARYKTIAVKDVLEVCGIQPGCDEIEFIACDTVIKKNKVRWRAKGAACLEFLQEHLGDALYFPPANAFPSKPFNFASSVPLRKVMTGEVVLAFEMNGTPLPHIHGFPCRVLVMGYQGARSPKWIKKVRSLGEFLPY